LAVVTTVKGRRGRITEEGMAKGETKLANDAIGSVQEGDQQTGNPSTLGGTSAEDDITRCRLYKCPSDAYSDQIAAVARSIEAIPKSSLYYHSFYSRIRYYDVAKEDTNKRSGRSIGVTTYLIAYTTIPNLIKCLLSNDLAYKALFLASPVYPHLAWYSAQPTR
jgi:hypothetical protein